MNVPKEIIELANLRVEARQNKDFTKADELRDQISELGWIVKDTAQGFEFSEKPPFLQHQNLNQLNNLENIINRKIGVCLLVDGWLDDTKECIESLLKYLPQETVITVLDLGNVENTGIYLEELQKENVNKLEVFHIAQTLSEAGWANSINKLIELNPGQFSVIMDLSSIVSGDVITPLINEIKDDVIACGWKGSLVNLEDQWRSVDDKGDGEVDILLGYLFAIKSKVAQEIPANSKAKFYRNADLEWSLMLRSAGHKLFAKGENLAVVQKRHHGYHDSEAGYRDKESRKNYDRILQNFRGKVEILSPRR